MTRTMKTSFKAALLAVAASAALVACGGGGDGAVAPAPASGTLRVALTDAPNCRVGKDELDKVFVTVERVRVHQSSDAEPSTGGWTDVVISPARKINLLDLTNGALEELGTTPIPAGNYTQVRLVLSANRGSGIPENSVVRAGETTQLPLQTPSAAQSGLKIIRPFTVAPNTTVDLVIDFDACRSIVLHGNGSYALKPVLTADLKHVGAIVGYIDAGGSTGVMVSAQKDGQVIRSTTLASDGAFSLSYLDSALSPYDVVITAPAKSTAAVKGVPAVNAVTAISTAAAKITMVTSPTAKASGTVGLAAGGPTAIPSVRATQAIGAAPDNIPVAEIAHVNAPVGTAYELTLPTGPARLAVFASGVPLSFSDQGTKSSYSLEASAPGYSTVPTAVLDVPVTQNFTLNPAP